MSENTAIVALATRNDHVNVVVEEVTAKMTEVW